MAEGLKGFSALRFFPITSNTAETYAVGPKISVPWVVSGTPSRQSQDFSLPADDVIYDSGSEFTGETWAIVVRELSPELEAMLDGADYDDATKEYSWGPNAVAPEMAMGFRALKRDGTYRMIKYYLVSVTSITVEYNTKGVNQEGSSYTINLAAKTRAADGKMLRKKDSKTDEDLAWLDTVDAIPAT